jgi:hypothetical protein
MYMIESPVEEGGAQDIYNERVSEESSTNQRGERLTPIFQDRKFDQ